MWGRILTLSSLQLLVAMAIVTRDGDGNRMAEFPRQPTRSVDEMLNGAEWNEDEAGVLLGAMATMLSVKGATAQQRVMVAQVEKRLGRRMSGLRPLDALCTLSHSKQQIAMQLLICLSCFREELAEDDLRTLTLLNRKLKLKSPWVQTLALGRSGKTTRASLSIGRRSPDARALMQIVWREEGLLGLLRAMRNSSGKGPANHRVAAKYQSLDSMPAGTLGNAFFRHMKERKLALPGEPGGIIEQGLQHDMMHVVTGFDTDPKGESRLAAYYFGALTRHPIKGADPFALIMVALMTFQLGYKIGPAFVGAEHGAVDPAELFSIYELGQKVSFNVLTEWKIADDFAVPLAQVRQRFGLDAEGGVAMLAGEQQGREAKPLAVG
jgi:hypothetical protein